MKIELKKIKVHEDMSEETTAFTAELWIEGVKAGYAKNDGRGGCTHYGSWGKEALPLLQRAEAWCKALPPKTYPATEDMDSFSIAMDLEGYIDGLVTAYEQRQWQKKMEKYMHNSIVYGTDYEFQRITWKVPLEQLWRSEQGRAVFEAQLKAIISRLKPGERILNTNIPETYFPHLK